ncbi:NAD(P)/FAD-dependent oxidoreductase [Aquabacterium sp. J223]|uniref:NAD(P)/FAD-dependent oxidoreductase n=1 Tax=Aquabacterium sp. J223 TaxID=2898431 RepID=UPI0021AD8D3F|nr:FAD-dependent oxidoreductase [Aquabacterium sp. J223]UUX94404.1 FAD-dependent oxidoreductase [Aquabacterium sp. J223]
MTAFPADLPLPPARTGDRPQHIAVVGSGISGLACAWLLSQGHRVTVFEGEARPGGHSHTVEAPGPRGAQAVDTGFIVYNEPAYPNLTALFEHLRVPTQTSDMSFAVSLDGGALEYAGTDLKGLFAQRRNLLRPRFWSMLVDLLRFYRQAPNDAAAAGLEPLDDYLARNGYGEAFRDDHLYPMAAAIWSTAAGRIGRHPTEAFIRFCQNHHLLQVSGRPAWRTVTGGSREYVRRLTAAFADGLRLDTPVLALRRDADGVLLRTRDGWWPERFDQVVLATHADQSLHLLEQPSDDERQLLGAFGYSRNHAVLHADPALMPQRREVWASWNYLADRRAGADRPPCVTYWMNRLQSIPHDTPLFLTLNPLQPPRPEQLIRTEVYEHPLFDAAAMRAQRALWTLQGRQRTWFCGAYFGAGFHEDGLQSGLAVAEALGGVRRPWTVANESGRIHLPSPAGAVAA